MGYGIAGFYAGLIVMAMLAKYSLINQSDIQVVNAPTRDQLNCFPVNKNDWAVVYYSQEGNMSCMILPQRNFDGTYN